MSKYGRRHNVVEFYPFGEDDDFDGYWCDRCGQEFDEYRDPYNRECEGLSPSTPGLAEVS